MALMDIPDLAAVARTVARILRPGGWFAFSITHPCLETALARPRLVPEAGGVTRREVRSYFVEGPWRADNPDGVRGRVDAYHRTLSTYLNTLVDAGLVVERLAEPQASGVLAERTPSHRDIPAPTPCAGASWSTSASHGRSSSSRLRVDHALLTPAVLDITKRDIAESMRAGWSTASRSCHLALKKEKGGHIAMKMTPGRRQGDNLR